MRIFLDSRDLINVFEGRRPCSPQDLRAQLERGGHRLVVSATVVFEIAAPLAQPSAKTNVMRLLHELETMPLAYVADSQIPPRELESAIRCYSEGVEYKSVDPYVSRLDAALQVKGHAPTRILLNFGIAETVFTLWSEAPDVFKENLQHTRRLQEVIAADRVLPDPPTVRAHFKKKVRRDLSLYGMRIPDRVESCAEWIYEVPSRCPGVRLAYETYHQIRRNLGDTPTGSDFGDFGHVQCLPYVDRITLDRRTAGYVRQASRGWPTEPGHKIRHDVGEILREL
jgi:hypothetical protein